MVNISIISDCNNNCPYCFQQKEYHNLHKMLSLSDIEEILYWAKGSNRIALMGGEPTLHPDFVKIVYRVIREFNLAIFTNLLCDIKTLNEITPIFNKILWLVNTTTNENKKELFNNNLEYINKANIRLLDSKVKMSFGITLMGNSDYDEKISKNLVDIGIKYPELVLDYRLALASPFDKKQNVMQNFDKAVKFFYDYSKKYTPNIKIGFDCCINNCLVSPEIMNMLLNDKRTGSISNNCCGAIDIMVDKSLKYCASMPDDVACFNTYKAFISFKDSVKYYKKFTDSYLNKNNYICRKIKDCTSDLCNGPCIARLEYLKRQC